MINYLINGEPVSKTTTPVYVSNIPTSPVSCNYSSCDEAFDSGYEEGYSQGHEDGYSHGHTEGYDEGYEAGLDEMVDPDQDYDNGYSAGHAAGYAKAKAETKAAEEMYKSSLKAYVDATKVKFVDPANDPRITPVNSATTSTRLIPGPGTIDIVAYIADIKTAPKIDKVSPDKGVPVLSGPRNLIFDPKTMTFKEQ